MKYWHLIFLCFIYVGCKKQAFPDYVASSTLKPEGGTICFVVGSYTAQLNGYDYFFAKTNGPVENYPSWPYHLDSMIIQIDYPASAVSKATPINLCMALPSNFEYKTYQNHSDPLNYGSTINNAFLVQQPWDYDECYGFGLLDTNTLNGNKYINDYYFNTGGISLATALPLLGNLTYNSYYKTNDSSRLLPISQAFYFTPPVQLTKPAKITIHNLISNGARFVPPFYRSITDYAPGMGDYVYATLVPGAGLSQYQAYEIEPGNATTAFTSIPFTLDTTHNTASFNVSNLNNVYGVFFNDILASSQKDTFHMNFSVNDTATSISYLAENRNLIFNSGADNQVYQLKYEPLLQRYYYDSYTISIPNEYSQATVDSYSVHLDFAPSTPGVYINSSSTFYMVVLNYESSLGPYYPIEYKPVDSLVTLTISEFGPVGGRIKGTIQGLFVGVEIIGYGGVYVSYANVNASFNFTRTY